MRIRTGKGLVLEDEENLFCWFKFEDEEFDRHSAPSPFARSNDFEIQLLLLLKMTSRGLRTFLAARTAVINLKRSTTHGPAEFREIRYTGYAPKYKGEFDKLQSKCNSRHTLLSTILAIGLLINYLTVRKPDPQWITSEKVLVAIVLVCTANFALKRYVVWWKQEAQFRRETEYRKAMENTVAELKHEYRQILDVKYPNA